MSNLNALQGRPTGYASYALVLGTLLALLVSSFAVLPGTAVASSSVSSPAPSLSPQIGGSPLPSATTSGDLWLEFQHDTQNSGVSGNPPVGSNLSWNASLPTFADGAHAPFVGSPVAGYGNVYVPTGNAITAYNASTGLKAWNTTLTPNAGGAGLVVDETPLLWNGLLIVSQDSNTPGGFPACVGNLCSYLYVLDAATGALLNVTQPNTGGTVWSGDPESNSPVPLNASDFNGSSGFLFLNHMGYEYTYTWNGTAVLPVGNNIAARTTSAGGDRTTSTPSLAYLPGTGWASFYLDAANSAIDAVSVSNASALNFVAGYPLASPIGTATMTFAGGQNSGSISIANISTPGGVFPVGFFGDHHPAGQTSLLYAVNLSNPANPLLASSQLVGPNDNGVLSAPALVRTNASGVGLIVTDLNGTVSRWNFYDPPTGTPSLTQVWVTTVGAPAVSAGSPAIAGNTVYVGNGTGGLLALNVSTGAALWNASLGAPVRSSFALGYDRLYAVADPVNGGPTAQVAAYGAPAPPALAIVSTLATPNPVTSGGTVTLKVNVTTGTALARSPASGATVSASFPFGTPLLVTGTTNSAGTATLSWVTPSSSPVEYNVTSRINVSLPGALPTSGSTRITVLPGGGSGGGVLQMTAALSPLNSSIAPGNSTNLTLAVNGPGGSPLPNATVTATLTGPGTLSAPPAPTDAAGKSLLKVVASSTVTTSQPILVQCQVSVSGYANTSAAAVVEVSVSPIIAPPGSTPLSATITPSSAVLWTGNVTPLKVVVINATSSKPVSAATVTLSLSAGTGSTVSPASATTDASGVAWFNLTAGKTAGAILVTVVVSAPSYTSSSAFASISVINPAGHSAGTSVSSTLSSPLVILLIGLVILLLLALLLALARRRSSPPPSKKSGEEKPEPIQTWAGSTKGEEKPADSSETSSGAAPPAESPSGEKPESTTPASTDAPKDPEWKEESSPAPSPPADTPAPSADAPPASEGSG